MRPVGQRQAGLESRASWPGQPKVQSVMSFFSLGSLLVRLAFLFPMVPTSLQKSLCPAGVRRHCSPIHLSPMSCRTGVDVP